MSYTAKQIERTMPPTPKKKVLKKYPNAYSYKWAGKYGWVIYADTHGANQGICLSDSSSTPAFAWQSAAAKLWR